jgi:hypothetical protein
MVLGLVLLRRGPSCGLDMNNIQPRLAIGNILFSLSLVPISGRSSNLILIGVTLELF